MRILQLLSRTAAIGVLLGPTATGCRGHVGTPPAQGQADTPPGPGRATPVYNRQTGKLEQLTSDRDGDGKIDTWASMDGTRVTMIETDRNGDGRPDRREYYHPDPAGAGDAQAQNVIDRAEETNGPDARVTRREFYVHGVLQRVEDDTDADGRVDKWEFYTGGRLERVELDLAGTGAANRRLFYGANGEVIRVEGDPNTGSATPGGSPVKKGRGE
jgi:hypothetical protein